MLERAERSNEFAHLQRNAQRFTKANLEYCLSREGSVDMLCRDCDFFKEDDWDLECGAFKILYRLLAKGIISPEDVVKATHD